MTKTKTNNVRKLNVPITQVVDDIEFTLPRDRQFGGPGKAALFTEFGGYVITVQLPPFNAWPGVLMWGQRVFRLIETNPKSTPFSETPAFYREGFTYFAFEDMVVDPDYNNAVIGAENG